MSRDKQISEIEIMAGEIDRILCEAGMTKPYPPLHPSIVRAKAFYNAGYRKASEVALEVIEDLEDKGLLNMEPWAIAELKKKYTEGE